jgi:hypothetical protein
LGKVCQVNTLFTMKNGMQHVPDVCRHGLIVLECFVAAGKLFEKCGSWKR